MKNFVKIIHIGITILLCSILLFVYNDSIKKPSVSYLESVTVMVRGSSGEEAWSGTGVIVKITEDYTYILTNNHVAPIEEQGNIFVENNNRMPKKAEILKNSFYKDEDMALIRVLGRLEGKRAVKGVRQPNKGDRVYIAGNSGGQPLVYREGIVSNMDFFRLYVQVPVLGGDSGTGIIDKDGYLVGLIFALKLDIAIGLDGSIVLVPNHTIAVAMKGVQVRLFLRGEI